MQHAMTISKKRKAIIPSFEKEVNALLKKLGMPNAIIRVQLDEQELGVHGVDKIQMLFDANKSGKFETIAKVASGGELSRLMLAVKSLVAGKMALPTLIFDEIDVGVSGRIAQAVGKNLKSLSTHHHVIAITHLPQIAGLADAHFVVEKIENGKRTATSTRKLNDKERVIEVAKLMSGEKVTDAALKSAKELMNI